MTSWLLADAYRLWRRRPLEAALGVIGVVAGVAGVVAVATIGAGARAQMLATVAELGATTIIVRSIDDDGLAAERAAAVARLLGGSLDELVPVARRAATVSADGILADDVPVVATSPAYRDLHHLPLDRGRFIAWNDLDSRTRVCVLGHTLAQQLYAHTDAIGQRVQVDGDWLTVVGTLAAQQDDVDALDDVSRAVFTPVRDDVPLGELIVRFRDDVALNRVGAALQRIVEFGGDRKFEYVLPIEIVRNKYRLQTTLGYLLAGMSAVLLVVGGTGIANAMLLNVVRRAAEIGLRRAVGATRRAILWQFLAEAALVSGFGGLGGIALGLIATGIVARVATWPIAWVGPACLIGVAVATGIGLAAGALPAWRAAQLDPKACLSRG